MPEGVESAAFLTVHLGEEAVWLLVDYWLDDLLFHQLFRADLETPTSFEQVETEGPMACVWELEVIVHERHAWVKHVLNDSPSVEDYLKDRLSVKGEGE